MTTLHAGVTLEQAMRLHALGFCLIPLNGKRADGRVLPKDEQGKATWKSYQETRSTPDELREWFGNGTPRNAAVVCGRVSRVVVIDTDTGEAEAWVAAHLPPTPMMTRTARGFHRYYLRPTALPAIPAFIRVGTLDIEVRRDGQYVVAPGSVHPGDDEKGIPAGHVYAEVEPWPATLAGLPVLPMAVFDAEEAATEKTKGKKKKSAPLPKVIGTKRNLTLTTEAGRLRRLGHSPGEIAASLHAINKHRCDPALPDSEIEHIAHSVGRYEAGQAQALEPDTESGDAAFFASLYRDTVRFDHRQERWLVLDDVSGIWLPDSDGAVMRLALAAMRERQRIAYTIEDDRRAKAASWAFRGESRARLVNMLALAKNFPPIADGGDNWDQISYLLGTPTGVVDLRSGIARRAEPDERITMRTSVPYDATATSALWDVALEAIFPDAAEREYLQTALGYTTTGETNLDKWFLPNGPLGRNGKGTLLGAVRRALGDYAIELDAATFDLRKEGSPFNLAKLPGKRFAHCSEAGDSTMLHHDRVKQVSGGDEIRAADKHQTSFAFWPCSKLWFPCNTRPRVKDESAAFWARVIVILFSQTFRGREDTSIRDALRHEPGHQQAVLRWLVDGAKRHYAQKGLGAMPPVFQKATNDFQLENEGLAEFYEQRCVIVPNAKAKASDLWKAYQSWAQDENVRYPLGSKSFYQKVANRFAKREEKDGNWYEGVGLAATENPVTDDGVPF